MEDNVQYPRFISNGPCGKDLFAGKAHQRIAEEIAQQLLQPDAPHNEPHNVPHVIGLDGGWGAGKSNIIEIVRRKAQEKKKVGDVLFFTYNAWGHQGDPLRRSILEELTRCVVSSDSALAGEKETWEEKLKTLTSQRKEVSTKTFRKLSTSIIVFSLISLLTPVFNAIAKALPAFLGQWTEGIVTATPILLALIYAVVKYLSMGWPSFKLFLSELSYHNKGGVQEAETHEEVYSSEATSTQFKDWISKLDEALKARLVIVIDDMDRLPARNVQELWAAIHTLFTEVKYERIKVIVPFDRSHIISAFREENIHGENSTPKCYGNDFIDKTFDVVYRVPPPILSDWKDYLSTQWKTAFGKAPKGLVTQIYDLLADGKTPREIIAFINECVTIKRTCTSEIPDEYIALFAVGKHEIVQDPQRELLELKFCQPLSYRYDNEETRKYLSAIHYQLEPDNALETIYVDQLRRELDKGKPTLLQELITKTQSFFTSILEHAIAEITHVENATMVFRAVEETTAIPQNFWDELAQRCISINEQVPSRNAQIALLTYSSSIRSIQFFDHIIEGIYNDCRINGESSSRPDFDALKFKSLIDNLHNATQELGIKHLEPFSRLHTEYTSGERYTKFVDAAKDRSKYYKICCETSLINDYILSEASKDLLLKYRINMNSNEPRNTTSIDYIEGAWPMMRPIRSLLIATTSIEMAEMLFTHWVNFELPAGGALLSEKQIAQFITESEKGSLLHNCTICQLIVHGGSNAHPEINAVLEEEDDELIQTLSELIDRFISYDDLLIRCETLGKYALYRKLVQKLFINRDEDGKSWTNAAKVIPHYIGIMDTLELPLETLLNDWEASNFQDSITTETIPSIPAQFFIDTRELGQNELVQHCRETAIQYLDTLSKEEWEIAVREKNHAYELFTALQCDPPENGKEILV